MTELVEVILCALACPLALPLVIEKQEKQNEQISNSNRHT